MVHVVGWSSSLVSEEEIVEKNKNQKEERRKRKKKILFFIFLKKLLYNEGLFDTCICYMVHQVGDRLGAIKVNGGTKIELLE